MSRNEGWQDRPAGPGRYVSERGGHKSIFQVFSDEEVHYFNRSLRRVERTTLIQLIKAGWTKWHPAAPPPGPEEE